MTKTYTVCPVCATPTPKPYGEVPEGWTTTVTVCSVCGPKTVTVTLTKPIPTPHPTPAEYTPEAPEETATSTIESYVYITVTPVPASSTPSPAPSAPAYVPEGEAPQEYTVTKGVTEVITLSKVPVPAYTPAPVYNATTGVYVPSGTAGSTGGYTATPLPFEGAASRMSVGLSAVAAVVVAGLLAL